MKIYTNLGFYSMDLPHTVYLEKNEVMMTKFSLKMSGILDENRLSIL